MKLKAICLGLIATGALSISSAVLADGATLYTGKLCNTCHGPDAKSPTTGMYPKLAGANADYLAKQMKDIKDGVRTNGMTIAMKATVATVKPEEFDEIAAWLAGQPAFAGTVAADDPAAKLFADKGCTACHGDDAKTPVTNDENGHPAVLAGQTEQYLLTQMKDIRDGKRNNGDSAKMNAKVQGIADADFQAIAKWLAAAK